MSSARTNTRNPFLDAALRYVERWGWAVFPLLPKSKEPFPRSRAYKDATTNVAQIKAWWRETPDANIGIACSSKTGPIVIDIDGPTGHEAIDALDLPSTHTARSSGEKRHLYFMPMKDGTHVRRIIRPMGKTVKLDILGDGGYVMAPPSIHPDTGKPYAWVRTKDPLPFPKKALTELVGTPIKFTKSKSGKVYVPAQPMPKVIGEGQRDNVLTSLAGTMRRRGASTNAILAALRSTNDEQVHPPLADAQLRKIAKSIGSKSVPSLTARDVTDIDMAERFAQAECAELCFCPAERKWYTWDGTRWAPDTLREVDRRVRAFVRRAIQVATSEPELDDAAIKKLLHYTRRRACDDIREVAATEPSVVVPLGVFDKNPWLLNVKNGTLDLKTGRLRPHRSGSLITKLAPVEFDKKAKAPRWDRFLHEIMKGDTELVGFVQRAVGYTLAGVTREQCLFFCHGSGANGKTTFLETLLALFGDYGVAIAFDTLLQKSRGAGDAARDLPRLYGARLANASETPVGARWNEATVKELTGDDTLQARWLYGEKFQFQPTHTLWCRANEAPESRDASDAFWRRVHLIPFAQRFPDARRDKKLADKLRGELSGILNWAIAGCLEWQRAGLAAPKRVLAATEKYRTSTHPLQEFIASRCRLAPHTHVTTRVLYAEFCDWWRSESSGRRFQKVPNPNQLGRWLSTYPKLRKTKIKNERGWEGIQIRSHDAEPSA